MNPNHKQRAVLAAVSVVVTAAWLLLSVVVPAWVQEATAEATPVVTVRPA